MSVCYRKVSPDIWDDEWFIDQDDAMRDLWFIMITGKQVLPIPGLQNVGPATLAEKLRRGSETVSEQFRKLIAEGRIEYDERLQVVRVPRAPFHNLPDNPNQVRGWWNAWKRMPNSALKYRHIASLKEALDQVLAEIEEAKRGAFLKAWSDTFETVPKPFPKGSETVSDRARASGAGSREQGAGSSDATHQADAVAPPASPSVPAEPNVEPKRKATPKAKQTSLPIAGTEPKPKAKKPNPVGDTIALYRDPYKAKYGCTYVTGGKDTEIAKTLNAKARALALELASDDPDGWSKCLTHWMLEYLDNDEPYYVENRHPLRLIDQRLNDYGNPWETPREIDADFEWGNIPPPHDPDPPGTQYVGPTEEDKSVLESFLGKGALDGFTPAPAVEQ